MNRTTNREKPNGSVPRSSKTLVTFLLDRTGSMEPIRDNTIEAFNAYLEGLQCDGAGIDFTLIQFDSMSIDKICVRKPVNECVKLSRESYVPRASTPLIDAACKTIKAVEASLNGDLHTKVVICIQTDGHENCSTEHTWDELNALIKHKTTLGWQFNFMGASIDAYDQGARMAISTANTLSYDSADRASTVAAFAASAANTTAWATGKRDSTAYTGVQKQASGDKFNPLASPGRGTGGPSKLKAGKIVEDVTL
jgi:hypothetical protein